MTTHSKTRRSYKTFGRRSYKTIGRQT